MDVVAHPHHRHPRDDCHYLVAQAEQQEMGHVHVMAVMTGLLDRPEAEI